MNEETHRTLRAIAGFLAESSVGRVHLRDPSGEYEFGARTTDLPGELLRALSQGGGTLTVPEMGLSVRFTPDALHWTCENSSDAVALARAIADAG